MATLAELIAARRQLTLRRERLAARRAALVDNQLRLEYATHRDQLLAPNFADPFRAPERALRRRLKETLPGERDALANEIRQLEDEIRTTAEGVAQLATAQPPLFDTTDHPVVLFPIRLETCFKPSGRGVDLLIRVYPDEIQIDGLRRSLSRAEREAGCAYWRAIWPTLGDAEALPARLNLAWKELGLAVDRERAPWVVVRTRPLNAPLDLGNPERPSDDEPRFETSSDVASDTPAAQVVLLPDRFVAYGLADDQLLFRHEGLQIRGPLPITAMRQTGGRRASAVDSEWLVDFDKALAAGMALSVPLNGARPSIDQLFVVGLSSTLTPDESARQIADALSVHANRNALEFLAPRAPTNNTADAASFWHSGQGRPTAPDAMRLGFKPDTMQNAAIVARALGIDGRDALATVTSALEDWQTAPGVLMDALWPAMTVDWDQLRRNELTLNEFGSSTQQASPYPEATMDALRSDTASFVRNRGPLPAVRIGRQPYGILPVSSLDLWENENERPIDAMKLGVLRHLRPFWQAGLAKVPRVHGRQDQDRALLEVLVQDAVSAKVTFRKAVGHDNYDSPEPLTITPDLPWQSSLLTRHLQEDIGLFDVPLVGDADKLLRYWAKRREIIDECLATPPADAQTIQNKANAFLGGQVQEGPPITKTLLYALFNYGQVREQDSIIGMDGITGDPNEFFARCAKRQAHLLDRLASLQPSELELLLVETLDLFSHRLDAWITSLATRRLSEMRAVTPTGCRIGNYGWVESLTAPETILDFDEVRERDGDTYVLAPSLHHAASAAVLRSGFDAHTDEGAFAVNLTSGRARRARWIVDGVRSGQTIGALLGYWFERGLHDSLQDQRIAPLRQHFPLPIVAGQQEEAPGQSFEFISARNVADGLALYRASTGTNEVALTDAAKALVAELKGDAVVGPLVSGLQDLVDAVGDLVLAESVHHLVGGNPLRAGLAADTLGRGESLPSRFDMIASPRSGFGLTCSVAALLPADSSAAQSWNADRPRATLSPQANAWVADMLGPATSWHIACDVDVDGVSSEATCELSDLKLSALDVVYDLQVRAPGTASVLERRVLEHVGHTVGPNASVRLTTGIGGVMWRTLASHVQRITGILHGARALQVSDLAPVDRVPNPTLTTASFSARLPAAGSPPSAGVAAVTNAARNLATASAEARSAALDEVVLASAIEITHRSNEFFRGVGRAATTLHDEYQRFSAAASDDDRLAAAKTIAAALRVLGDYGVEGSYPVGSADSLPIAQLVAEQGRLVLATVDALDVPQDGVVLDAPVSLRAWIDDLIATVRRVAGDSFPLAASFVAPPDGELADNLTGESTLKNAEYPDVMVWLRRLGRVRPALRDFHDSLLTAELRDRAPGSVRVTQTPHDNANDQWAAQDFNGRRPAAPQRTAVLHIPRGADPKTPLCGWLIDAWSERIPGLAVLKDDPEANRSELAGLTFHFNQPDAQAPHAILVAVPPDVSKPWTEETLLKVVSETLDLAKIRAMDHRDLPRVTPFLPATYIVMADENGDKWPLEMNPDIF